MDINHLYLKLRFAGMTTRQIHQLFNYECDFGSYNKREQQYKLKLYLTKIKSTKKMSIYDNFIKHDIESILLQLDRWKVKFIGIKNTAYPNLLREIFEPPLILFYKGNLSLAQNAQSLAVVGSRQATSYTNEALRILFPSFKKRNLTIVSGLAEGADKLAHQHALAHHMPAIAVLGFGHLNHYPKTTYVIRKQLEQKGLVVSEYLPYQKPLKHHFPERNRIISGLSKGVLITESTINSGTSITTNCALDQNREVYVLPGSIFNKMTMGNLISAQEGAKIVISAKDIIEDCH
ncbi:DNA-processing protein DprA [Staphylococcus nepalensis]|uniref:DNA-processing protein DprA n=1 Tax=Staphylococcus nepalensis TaxID=214473 RepID=UPI00230073EA|nr:DNA-processing protein DprA [Staphylococcus nepalensis]